MKLRSLFKKETSILLAVITVLFFTVACEETKEEEVTHEPEGVEILEDMGFEPWAFDIEKATLSNDKYRKAIWTGEFMQLVLMSLKPGENIDLELHKGHDQFVRVEKGQARILMGLNKEDMTFDEVVEDDWAILIPAGYWHEIRNTGDVELKLYTLYAPPEHPTGIVNETYDDALEYEKHHHHHHHHNHDHDHEHDQGYDE